LPAFDLVDEVWMNSEYAAESVRKVATKPVYSFPLTVSVPESEAMDKSKLGLPDRFMFLFSFDFFSIFERKNPVALIEAFRLAFEPGEGPILVVKSINGDKMLTDLEQLRMAAADHPDVYVMDGYLPVEVKNRLMATCDAYVSLHRSEGFGLTMAEAMALGKPTIATGYSGNLEFMDADNSYLVKYKPTTVPEGCDPYPVGATWAEPSVEHAAKQMRRVYDNPEEAAAIGAEAKRIIAQKHDPDARARLLRRHLARIRSTKQDWGSRRSLPSGAAVGGVSAAVLHATAAVEWPIENEWLDEGASGGISGKVRAAALSALRPALARERAIDEKILTAVAELWDEVRRVDASVSETRSLMASEQDRSEDLHLRSDERHDVSDERHHASDKRHEQFAQEIAESQRESDKRKRKEDKAAAKAAEGAAAFRSDATAHLARLSDQVGELQQWSNATDADLHARPYMADAEMFTAPDGSMGFSGGQGGDPYRDFEDVFRGEEDFIRERQRFYLPLLGDGPVLDAGSGRGEFLELLAEAGIEAVGVDLERGMVERCEAKGHNVIHADVIDYLRDAPDAHFGTVFSAQFIEHIPLSGLVEFLELSVRKLRPGGVFIAETVNPHSLPAFRTFWTDLTHRAPIYPEVVLSLVKSTGFDRGEILFPNGMGDHDTDLRAEGEYAVVAHVDG
ncbi:MAG: glycosyltransferase, partial [Actinomycetota bacterium]|nr:glycosyltransferase [Actinomycetota bacterium]